MWMKYDEVQHAVQSPQGTFALGGDPPVGRVASSHVEKLPADTDSGESLTEDGDIAERLSL